MLYFCIISWQTVSDPPYFGRMWMSERLRDNLGFLVGRFWFGMKDTTSVHISHHHRRHCTDTSHSTVECSELSSSLYHHFVTLSPQYKQACSLSSWSLDSRQLYAILTKNQETNDKSEIQHNIIFVHLENEMVNRK